MKKIILISISVFVVIAVSGCASILSKSKYTVKVNSNPEGANVFVVNMEGEIVAQAVTPGYVNLKSGHMSKNITPARAASYSIIFAKNGYHPKEVCLVAGSDPVFYFNILFWPGMELDHNTGAGWKLPENVYVNLTKQDKPSKLSDKEFISQYKEKLSHKLALLRIQHGFE